MAGARQAKAVESAAAAGAGAASSTTTASSSSSSSSSLLGGVSTSTKSAALALGLSGQVSLEKAFASEWDAALAPDPWLSSFDRATWVVGKEGAGTLWHWCDGASIPTRDGARSTLQRLLVASQEGDDSAGRGGGGGTPLLHMASTRIAAESFILSLQPPEALRAATAAAPPPPVLAWTLVGSWTHPCYVLAAVFLVRRQPPPAPAALSASATPPSLSSGATPPTADGARRAAAQATVAAATGAGATTKLVVLPLCSDALLAEAGGGGGGSSSGGSGGGSMSSVECARQWRDAMATAAGRGAAPRRLERWWLLARILSLDKVVKVSVETQAMCQVLMRCRMTASVPMRALCDPLIAAWMLTPDQWTAHKVQVPMRMQVRGVAGGAGGGIAVGAGDPANARGLLVNMMMLADGGCLVRTLTGLEALPPDIAALVRRCKEETESGGAAVSTGRLMAELQAWAGAKGIIAQHAAATPSSASALSAAMAAADDSLEQSLSGTPGEVIEGATLEAVARVYGIPPPAPDMPGLLNGRHKRALMPISSHLLTVMACMHVLRLWLRYWHLEAAFVEQVRASAIAPVHLRRGRSRRRLHQRASISPRRRCR